MSLREIKKIARQVRKAFEVIEKGEGSYSGPYDLGGYCGRASVQLYLACRRQGITLKLVEGEGHLFNMYGNYIVDVTATQFGHEQRIYVKKVGPSSNLPDYHTPIRYHKNIKSAETIYGNPRDTIRDKKIVRRVMRKQRNVRS